MQLVCVHPESSGAFKGIGGNVRHANLRRGARLSTTGVTTSPVEPTGGAKRVRQPQAQLWSNLTYN